jgi:methylthioribulose-1-phosphate dehydratase
MLAPTETAAHRPDLALRLCDTIAQCEQRGWCRGTGGNFSALLSRHPCELLITPSGMDKARIAPGDLLVVDDRGRPCGDLPTPPAAPAVPSAETLLHCAVVRTTQARAVLHTHSVAATLLGEHFLPQGELRLRNYEMLKGLRGIRTHETEVVVPILANSQDIAALAVQVEEMLAATPGVYGFLLAGHGLYTWGAGLEEAKCHLEVLEFLFEAVARRTPFTPFLGT